VAGNLLGRLFFILALILAVLPMLLGLQILGGVGPRPLLLAAAISACTAMVVAAVAVTLSATRSGGRQAVIWFFVGVVAVLAATWAGHAWIRQPIVGTVDAWATSWMTPLNPFLTLETVLHPSTLRPLAPPDASGLTRFWLSRPVLAFAAASGLVTLLLIGWATLRVRMLGPLLGTGGQRRSRSTRRHRPVGLNPIAWRASAGRPRGRMADLGRWGWATAGVLTAVIVLSLAGGRLISPAAARAVLTVAVGIEIASLVLIASTTAALSVANDRANGSLDLLLTTPIQPRLYLRGTLRGLVRHVIPMLLPPIFTLMVSAIVAALMAPATVQPTPSWGGMIALALVLIPFTAVCIAMGMSWSVRSRRPLQAVCWTVGLASLAAGLFVPCVLPGAAAAPWWTAPLITLSPMAALTMAASGPVAVSASPWAGLAFDQWYFAASGLFAAIVWSALAAMFMQTTARIFVVTVRRLAGGV